MSRTKRVSTEISGVEQRCQPCMQDRHAACEPDGCECSSLAHIGRNTDHGTEDTCPEAPHGGHEPDLSSITLSSDGGEFYLDVSCVHCGRSGCLAGPKQLSEMEPSW